MVIDMETKALKPCLRFKGFTDTWEQCEFKEIFNYERPDMFIVSNEEYSNTYSIPVLTANKGFVLGYTNETRTYNEPCVIFDDFTLDSKYVDFPFMVKSSAMKILTNKEGFDLRFSHELLNSVKIENLGHARHYISVVQPTIVRAPKLSEQKEISALFRSIDSLITLHQRKYDKLVNVKKALLDKMFTKNGEVVPKLRFKGFTDTWELCKLGDIGTFKSNGVDKLSKPNEIPVNLLNYMDVYNRRKISNNNASELMQVTAKQSQLIENNILKNDVFFTPTSETPEDIGRVFVIEETLNNTVYSYHLMRYRPNNGVFYPNFPNYSLMTSHVRNQFFISAKGVQRYVVSKVDFEAIENYIPKYTEQAKIGEMFRTIDSLITLHQRKYEKLVNMKKALLQKMFV